MAITVKHSKVSTIPDDADTSLVRPSDWNADHTLTGTIDIANGGTGQTTANAAFNALVPSQTGNTGKYLTTNGTNTSWATVSGGSGTVTSVDLTASTGISVSGGPITTSGSITVTNTAPDQVVSLTAGTGISTSGTYPNFTITNTSPSSGGTVTSVGLTSSAASLAITNTPITSSGNIGVNFSGIASQYVRGDGSLANFPTSTGGGSSVSYYLNGSVNQGTFVGNTYYQMSKTPIFSTGTNFSIATNGYITQFITDANDPSLLSIPAGNWNFEMYFSASSSGGTPNFYVELYKYDGTTFTLISSGSASPEDITGGTSKDLYVSALAVAQTTLTATDRLAVRVYVNNSGRTITLHTEDNNLCQVITTFSTGINTLNGLSAQVQYFATGTSGSDFNINSATATHTFNLPSASGTNRGALTSADWTTFNNKVTSVSGTAPVVSSGGTTPAISMAKATTSVDGYLSATDFTTFNNKGNGTVTSVAALTLGTTGTDLSSTVANGTTTPVITLNVPTASATNRGALSSADWTTFNNKGSGSVTSVSGTGTVSGISLSGTVTSTGNLTLGGTLNLSSPPVIGNTTPAAITGTTITATTFVGVSGGTF